MDRIGGPRIGNLPPGTGVLPEEVAKVGKGALSWEVAPPPDIAANALLAKPTTIDQRLGVMPPRSASFASPLGPLPNHVAIGNFLRKMQSSQPLFDTLRNPPPQVPREMSQEFVKRVEAMVNQVRKQQEMNEQVTKHLGEDQGA